MNLNIPADAGSHYFHSYRPRHRRVHIILDVPLTSSYWCTFVWIFWDLRHELPERARIAYGLCFCTSKYYTLLRYRCYVIDDVIKIMGFHNICSIICRQDDLIRAIEKFFDDKNGTTHVYNDDDKSRSDINYILYIMRSTLVIQFKMCFEIQCSAIEIHFTHNVHQNISFLWTIFALFIHVWM